MKEDLTIPDTVKNLPRKMLEECYLVSIHKENEATHRANYLEDKIDFVIDYIKKHVLIDEDKIIQGYLDSKEIYVILKTLER